MSVLEHGVVSFYFTGVSRSFTHELVRHRHFSYSQLSQRYVNEANAEMVVPPVIGEDPDLLSLFTRQCDNAKMSYLAIGSALMEKFERLYPDWSKTAQRKASRQAARSVLPNATETKIVITGNYRAWRHFLAMRASGHAPSRCCVSCRK
jgi:thymidylate synthase (FAD)